MATLFKSITSSRNSCRKGLALVLLIAVWTEILFADVCVWRDPERTMQKIFPQARDYRTLTLPMTPARISAIEKLLGEKLDESEKKEFNFYEINGVVAGKPQAIGTILALAGRGEYGVIEVVIGIDTTSRISGVYVQRSRERVTRAIEAPAFLEQFRGKTKNDSLDVGKAIKPASAESDKASRVISATIRKMLVFHDVLHEGEKKP